MNDMVATNIGLIPKEDYLDIMAMQYGFESYEDLKKAGYEINVKGVDFKMVEHARHKLRIKEEFANAIITGEKNFEIRKNDRGFQRGDLIEFVVVDDKGVAYHHEIDEYLYKINYVMNGYGLKNGYVVFGIEDVFK